jgi:hypothetical protein
LEASAKLAREPDLQVVLTSMGSLWILNRTTEKKTISAGELFGFNLGAYVEVPAGPGFENGCLPKHAIHCKVSDVKFN